MSILFWRIFAGVGWSVAVIFFSLWKTSDSGQASSDPQMRFLFASSEACKSGVLVACQGAFGDDPEVLARNIRTLLSRDSKVGFDDKELKMALQTLCESGNQLACL